MIQEIITLLRKKTKYKYYFDSANVKNAPCIVYQYSPNYNNGIRSLIRLTLIVITPGTNENSIIENEKISKDINKNILTFGDNPLTKNILSVEQNGGGLIPNKGTNTLHNFLYYDVIYREKR